MFLTHKVLGGNDFLRSRLIFFGYYFIIYYILSKIYEEILEKENHYVIGFLSSYVSLQIVNRCFNDCFTMLYFYIGLYLLISRNRIVLSTIFFGIALSCKMNVVLFLPGIFYIYIKKKGPIFLISQIILILLIQILMGLPFILTYPLSYLKGAYNVTRVFDLSESINWQFLSLDTFYNPLFHKFLLFTHLFLLICFLIFVYEKPSKNILVSLRLNDWSINAEEKHLDKKFMAMVIFTSNFIGIACGRSLHYQFFLWFFESLPFLFWLTRWNFFVKVFLMLIYSYSWSYRKHPIKSLILNFVHIFLISSILFGQFSWFGRKNQDKVIEKNVTEKKELEENISLKKNKNQ